MHRWGGAGMCSTTCLPTVGALNLPLKVGLGCSSQGNWIPPPRLQQAVTFHKPKPGMHCTPIATVSGRRSTPSTGGTESTIQAVQHGTLTGARPLTPTQEQRLIETVTTLGARAAPAVLLSVIAICRQYLTEPQQQTVRAHEN